ncbi:MAG: TetR/AcrR family transcriptional regulator [Deltaproteobacteria bacterium]|nr:TetR/AcrR family transcriptional regulator [Deltaproteobacteria bacterium]MBW2383896.1 TetR/AcrR family transcriptional regulator [Deltaproteobacteria bacterium]
MPKIVNAEIQREDIRAAARRVFAQRGVGGTGLAHVAAAAGMGRSSLYHYYADKDSLVADLVREMLHQERDLFRSCLCGGGSAIGRLEALVRACATLFPEWAAFGRMIIELRLADAGMLRGYFRELRRDIRAVILEGQADASVASTLDAGVLASILIGAIDGLLLQYFVDPDALPSPEALAQDLVDTMRRMVAP